MKISVKNVVNILIAFIFLQFPVLLIHGYFQLIDSNSDQGIVVQIGVVLLGSVAIAAQGILAQKFKFRKNTWLWPLIITGSLSFIVIFTSFVELFLSGGAVVTSIFLTATGLYCWIALSAVAILGSLNVYASRNSSLIPRKRVWSISRTKLKWIVAISVPVLLLAVGYLIYAANTANKNIPEIKYDAKGYNDTQILQKRLFDGDISALDFTLYTFASKDYEVSNLDMRLMGGKPKAYFNIKSGTKIIAQVDQVAAGSQYEICGEVTQKRDDYISCEQIGHHKSGTPIVQELYSTKPNSKRIGMIINGTSIKIFTNKLQPQEVISLLDSFEAKQF